MNSKPVTKAVIASAGFGTRFLPQTKAMPKEMLPLIDKPIIQYVVEELVDAGIKDIIIVTGYAKRSIEDHFDYPNQDLVGNLRLGGENKKHYIDEVEAISNLANFIYVRQKGPYGSGTPIMNAQHLIGDEPFLYVFADDLFKAGPSRFKQIIAMHEEFGGSVFPCITATKDEDFTRYGIMAGTEIRGGVLRMTQIIEKPGRQQAPSNFASVGGFLFTPDVYEYLEREQAKLDSKLAFYLQPAVQEMINDGKSCIAFELQNAKYYDTGDKLEYLKTMIDFALEREDIGPSLKAHLLQRLSA